MKVRHSLKSVAVALLWLMATAQPALAYIDPNTGGMLFQVLAVIFASLSAILLIFSRQIRMLVARIRRAVRGLFESRSDAGPELNGRPASPTDPADAVKDQETTEL